MSYKRIVIKKYGGPDVLQLVEEDTLPEPQAGEVRVKVLTASVAFTDTMLRTGNYPDLRKKLPFSPGYDLVGVIDKLGAGVTELTVGQRVADLTVFGAYTEYICLPAKNLVPVPDGLDSAEAVTLILSYITAYQMLHRIAKVQRGQRILVHGAGGAVGMALLQLGGLLELQTIGTASQSKHDFVHSMGATHIDYNSEDFVERTLALTGDGVDAVFDAISVNNFKRSFQTLRDGGVLVTYGFYNATIGTDKSQIPQIVREFLNFQLNRLRWNYFSGKRKATFYNITGLRKKHPDWFREDLTTLFNLTLEGKLKPTVWKKMRLEDAAEAHQLIESAKPQGKIVLMMEA